MNPYKIRVTRLTVAPDKEPIFSEMATHIEIEDEAAGEYLKVSQHTDTNEPMQQQIIIDPEQWPVLKEAIETLIKDLQNHEH